MKNMNMNVETMIPHVAKICAKAESAHPIIKYAVATLNAVDDARGKIIDFVYEIRSMHGTLTWAK